MATENYAPFRVLYGVKCPCKVSFALLYSFQRYALFLLFFILSRDMLGFVFWPLQTHVVTSSIPNLHIRTKLEYLWKEERYLQNKNTILFLLQKAFSISLFFNTLIFHIIGTLRSPEPIHLQHGDISSRACWHIKLHRFDFCHLT